MEKKRHKANLKTHNTKNKTQRCFCLKRAHSKKSSSASMIKIAMSIPQHFGGLEACSPKQKKQTHKYNNRKPAQHTYMHTPPHIILEVVSKSKSPLLSKKKRKNPTENSTTTPPNRNRAKPVAGNETIGNTIDISFFSLLLYFLTSPCGKCNLTSCLSYLSSFTSGSIRVVLLCRFS